MDSADVLESGRRAFDGGIWAEAYDRLSAAARQGALSGDDLERLATAAHLAGHDEESAVAWTRAHQARLDRDEPAQAARCAFWLGLGLLQRGEVAQGGGWLARARRLVEERDLDCVERGYLLVTDALIAMDGGDHPAALACCEQASTVARRFADADLSALGRLGRGQALLRMGRAAEGVGLFDEAMVAITAGEISPAVAGMVYCAVIDECQQAFDLRRAHEWTAALDRWCDAQPGLVPYRGQCLVHRSQVMQLHGAWREAMTEAERACERLADPPHPAIGMAHYQVAELHRVRGRLADADDAYRRAHQCGRLPHPGLALLRLDQGRVGDAVAAIRRALGDATDPLGRVRLLPACTEIMLAAGRVAEARTAVDELTELAARADAAPLQGAAAHWRGAVRLAEGDPLAALDALRDARRTWQELRAPYEAARARVLIALACQALEDHDTAELERDAARRAFEALGAAPALSLLEQRVEPARRKPAGPHHLAPVVTAREGEVLRLVAQGRTNAEIAEALVISEKTVERHLTNIYRKVGVANRAGATAYAYDHGLV